MMQMLMASHISEGLGPVPPIPVEDKPWLTAEVDKGTVVRRAVKERLTPMGSQPGCIHQTARLCFDIERPITAVRAWLIDNAGEGNGEPVITGLAFRYRGSDRFIPDAPDAQDDANRRGRDPQTFREQTETLAAGESIVAVKCSSTAMEFTSEITFTTSQGRALVFGSHGTVIPWGPPDEMSADLALGDAASDGTHDSIYFMLQDLAAGTAGINATTGGVGDAAISKTNPPKASAAYAPGAETVANGSGAFDEALKHAPTVCNVEDESDLQFIFKMLTERMEKIRTCQITNDREQQRIQYVRETSECNQAFHQVEFDRLTGFNDAEVDARYAAGAQMAADLDVLKGQHSVTKQTFFNDITLKGCCW